MKWGWCTNPAHVVTNHLLQEDCTEFIADEPRLTPQQQQEVIERQRLRS